MNLTGHSLRIIRTHLQLSLEEVGQATGYNASYLSRVETGCQPVTKQIQSKVLPLFVERGLSEQDILTISELFNKAVK